jgi:hypothetical protein
MVSRDFEGDGSGVGTPTDASVSSDCWNESSMSWIAGELGCLESLRMIELDFRDAIFGAC